MPIIRISGLPASLSKPQFKQVLADWRTEIIRMVLGIPELGLSEPKQVTVRFPIDMLEAADEPILIEVTGLTVTPTRTDGVRNKLAEALSKKVHEFMSGFAIECLIYPFDPQQGFYAEEARSSST